MDSSNEIIRLETLKQTESFINEKEFDEKIIDGVLRAAEISNYASKKFLLLLSDRYIYESIKGAACFTTGPNSGPLDGVMVAEGISRVKGDLFGYYNWKGHDCGVALSRKLLDLYSDYPAFCVSIIAHELGHVKLYLNDEKCFALTAVVQTILTTDNSYRFFGLSTNYDFPEEIAMDKFGKYVAETMFSKQCYENDIRRILNDGIRKDRARLEQSLKLECSTDFSQIWKDTVSIIKRNEPKFRGLLKHNIKYVRPLPKCLKSEEELFTFR